MNMRWMTVASLIWVGVAATNASAGEESTPASPPGAAADEALGWRMLWEADQMPGWKEVPFGGDGSVSLTNGVLTIGSGIPLTGLVYTNPTPRMEYEIELETKRVSGYDFGCGLTFPVADECCTLIFGGWGGGVVGISSIDGLDASENSTGVYREIKKGQWYHLRIRVEAKQIEVWLDRKPIIHQELTGRKVGMRPGEIEMCKPFGLATYETVGAIRGLRLRGLSGADWVQPPKP